jgi:hypothetical protein
VANVVTLSLDDVAFAIWKQFPKGTRSPSIAAILKDADELRLRGQLIELLRKQIRLHKELIYALDLRLLNETTLGDSHPSDGELQKMRDLL